MRKAINVAALIVFIWLVIDTLQIHNFVLSVLLAGVIPGTDLTLHPFVHLALLATVTVIIILELFTDNLRVSKYIRNQFTANKTSRA